MIGNIGVMGAACTGAALGGEGRGGEFQGPEEHSGGFEVETPGGDNAIHLGPVELEIVAGLWDAPAEDQGATLCTGHVVEPGAGVEVMAAAGAPADGCASTVAAIGEGVAAETDDQVRIHGDLRGFNRSA